MKKCMYFAQDTPNVLFLMPKTGCDFRSTQILVMISFFFYKNERKKHILQEGCACVCRSNLLLFVSSQCVSLRWRRPAVWHELLLWQTVWWGAGGAVHWLLSQGTQVDVLHNVTMTKYFCCCRKLCMVDCIFVQRSTQQCSLSSVSLCNVHIVCSCVIWFGQEPFSPLVGVCYWTLIG